MTSRFCENCGTAIDPGQRFCGGCGQPVDGSAPAAPAPMMSTPTALASSPAGWHMPAWGWMLMGLLFAGGIGGGLFYMFQSVVPKQPVYTKAQQDSIAQHVTDDLPANPDGIDLNKATNPTDLPPDLQKKFDNSALSEQHRADMAAALGPIPKVGDEIVNTKRAPTLADDFSDPGSGWSHGGSPEKALYGYQDGRLTFTFFGERGSAQSLLNKKVQNFAMQLEATPVAVQPGLWYGIVVRQSSADKFVVFMISPDGYYALSKRENGQNTPIEEPFKSPAIKTGRQTNFIKAYVVDQYFVFEVNGQPVSVHPIEGYEAGVVGTMVVRTKSNSKDPATVWFDNFKLWAAR